MTVNASQAYHLFSQDLWNAHNQGNIFVADKDYAVPRIELYKDAHKDHLSWLRSQLGDDYWRAEIQDCDDFAKTYQTRQLLQNRITAEKHNLPLLPLPIAQIWYNTDQGGGHAINAAIYRNRHDEMGVCYIEPQKTPPELFHDGGIVTLSENEKSSCWLCVL